MILNRQRKVRVAIAPLDRFLGKVCKETGVGEAEITVCLVSDPEIARLNKTYRKKKGPTDVLSFPAKQQERPLRRRAGSSGKHSGAGFLGDIAIAPQMAGKYAKKNDRGLQAELKVLILHGVLHLMGYDHELDQGEMHRLEKRLRRRLGLE